jgi:hypothetical protein
MTAPKINDQYWFDYSQKVVDKAIESRDQAGAKLQTLAVWLWSIYTAAAGIGIVLTRKNLSLEATALIALGSVGIISVYWAAVWVQMPVVSNFDPRSPDEIQASYALAVREKQRRLQWALGLGGVASSIVAMAIVTAAVGKPATIADNDFKAVIYTQVDHPFFAVSGKVPNATYARVVISDVKEPIPAFSLQAPHAMIPTDDGIVQSAWPLPSNQSPHTARITIQWRMPDQSVFQLTKVPVVR